MAKIHKISGSTKYLLNGTRVINGKKLETLDELRHLHDHYEEFLAEIENTVARQQDEKISRLGIEESTLSHQLQEGIAQQTVEVNQDLSKLNDKISAAGNIFTRTGFKFQYWIAYSLRDRRIRSPFSGTISKLNNVHYSKKKHIEDKPSVIKNECYNVTRSYTFLKENQTFLFGAIGEEEVIENLSQLSDEFYVLNDVNLHFDRAIHWHKYNEYIKNCQIDHIVVGPTGIYLLETKNWKVTDIEVKSDKLIHQVQRSNLALWLYLKNYYRKNECPKIFGVVVSMNSFHTSKKLDQYIDIITPSLLCGFITRRKIVFSEDQITRLVEIINRSGRIRTRF